jgi:hypothetical protein
LTFVNNLCLNKTVQVNYAENGETRVNVV